MIRKYFIAAIIIGALGAGAFFLLRFIHGKSADEASGGDEKIASIVSVQTTNLQRATLRGYIEAFGAVTPAPGEKGEPAAVADVAAPVAGVITAVKVWEGAPVKQGDLLFQLDSRVADVAVDFSQKALARQRALFDNHNTSQKAVEDAEQQAAQAKAQQELLQIRAPLSGTVTKVNVHPGEAVDLTSALAHIIDLSRLVITADIPAGEAGPLKTGQTAVLETDPPKESKVLFVSPGIQASNGAVSVRISLPDGSGLRPGQYLKLRIITETHTNCLAVPAESVVKNYDGQDVIAVVTNGVANQVGVTTGLRENGLVEVTGGGIKEGDAVVTAGAYGLPAQTKVTIEKP
jgi:membrane fusion protein (multidrug efflux system)